MHGNVQEWVQDWFEEYYYFESPPVDPLGPKHGTLRTVRGGCWGFAGTPRAASPARYEPSGLPAGRARRRCPRAASSV